MHPAATAMSGCAAGRLGPVFGDFQDRPNRPVSSARCEDPHVPGPTANLGTYRPWRSMRGASVRLFLDIQFGRVAPGNGIVDTMVQFFIGGRLPVFQRIERTDKFVSGIIRYTDPDISFFLFGHDHLQLEFAAKRALDRVRDTDR